MQKVIVMSRYRAEQLVQNEYHIDRVIVSISTVDWGLPNFINEDNHSIHDICYVEFNDVDRPDPFSINPGHAKKIATFVKKYWDKVDQIVVHCDAGVSRSAGCAAAILKYFIGDDSQIFNDPQYYPNMMVYRFVLEALMEEN